jgi:hypothetical protein
MLASRERPGSVVDLPGAGVPADLGMASLGLVMQLAARTSGALAALAASIVVLEPRLHRHDAWLLFAIGLCIARSLVHRVAGRDLVYGRPTADGAATDPLDATRAYITVGIGHALAIGLIAARELGATPVTAAALVAALALWPIVLAAVVRLPRVRALGAGVPLGEDRGLEAASILMTVLGACGALSSGAIILLLGGLPRRYLEHGWGTMLVVVFALLLVRSCLHMRVGIAGLGAGSFDRPGELAARYASFAVISAICVSGVFALFAMSARLFSEVLPCVAVVCWLLAVWPVIVRRYFYHRQFAELLAGDRVLHRRAPDAGLTGLGWLLAGHATVVAAVLILELAIEPRGIGWSLDSLLALAGPLGRSSLDAAIATAVVGLEALAAVALIRMSDHRRVIATIYALIAGGVALAAAWPMARTLGRHATDLPTVVRWIPAAIQIVIPAATLVFVHRAVVPAARARYARK